MKQETLFSILKNGLKLFLILVPWQTLYIVQTGLVPIESVVIHVSVLLVSALSILALVLYKPKINFKIMSFVCLTIILQLITAQEKLLVVQYSTWLLLAGGLWWLFSKNILSRSEQITYLVIGAIAPTLLGLWQFFAQTSITSTVLGLSFISPEVAGSPVIVGEAGRWLRAFGSFPHPNIFGGYLVAILGLILSRDNKNTISNNDNWPWRLVVIILSTALVLTFSRSALAVWILFMIFYHYRIFKTERGSELAVQVFISVLTVALVLSFTWPIWSGRLGQGNISQNETVAVYERVTGNQVAIKIITDNWLLGVGPGNYTQALHKASPELKTWELAPVHNVPLLILAEWGLAGMMLLGLLVYYLRAQALFLLPIVLLDHYFYSQWPGIVVGVILILSTVYPHRCSTEPKN